MAEPQGVALLRSSKINDQYGYVQSRTSGMSSPWSVAAIQVRPKGNRMRDR